MTVQDFEREVVQDMVNKGLTTDGAQHKQYVLERIAHYLELEVVDHEPGVPP